MNNLNKLKAFTIIEMILVILIIWIITVWITKINFNNISWKQRIEIFSNKIKSNFENIRNDSLLWKWIWENLIVPEMWKIEIWNWWLTSSYLSWSWYTYEEYTLPLENFYEIHSTKCLNINWEIIENEIWTWTIIIEWSNLSFSWALWLCINPSSKIFQFNIEYQNNFEKKLSINILNWLLEIK